MLKIIPIIFFCLMTGFASAQMVIQADKAMLQPQINRDDEGFSACGVRVVVVNASKAHVDAYDFSLMVNAKMTHGMLKAGKSRTLASAALKGNYSNEPAMPPPVKFWIAQENEGKAINPLKIMAAETKGYILEISDVTDTLKGIIAIINGQRMQFAIRYKNEPVDLVVSFFEQMPDLERLPLMKCLDEVVFRITKSVETTKR